MRRAGRSAIIVVVGRTRLRGRPPVMLRRLIVRSGVAWVAGGGDGGRDRGEISRIRVVEAGA